MGEQGGLSTEACTYLTRLDFHGTGYNASLLVEKDLIVPDDAFPIAQDNNARAKAVVDLVTLQVNRRHHRRQMRHAGEQQRAQCCPTAGPGCNSRRKHVTAGSQAQNKGMDWGGPASLHRCTHGCLSERRPERTLGMY